MAISERKKTCFVIMPFGEKKDLDGNEIDFDDIYRFFFKKTLEEFGIDCTRCDEIDEAGSIHEKMFEHIYHSDIVVVDITTTNANVFYELGIRHALAKGVTVLIRRKGTTMPFNIQNLQVIEYDQAKFASIEQAQNRIHNIIKNGLSRKKNDSPVHSVLELNIEPEGKPIDETRFYLAQLKDNRKVSIGLVTGDIQHVKGIDIWVNSENTHMQMARPFENSISGIIRYLGAEKDSRNAHIKRDTIVEALQKSMGTRTTVDPATVIVTNAGAMSTLGVKKIFHVAANYGQVGRGYIPIDQVARCVMNALWECEDHNNCTSILFPLMATKWRRGGSLKDQVRPLFNVAIDYLGRKPKSPIQKVYFLAYSDKEFDVCSEILKDDKRLLDLCLIANDSEQGNAEQRVSGSPASA